MVADCVRFVLFNLFESIRVHLRKNDFLFEVADELNTLLDTMAERQPAVAAALPADGSRSSEPPDGWYAMEPTSEEAGTSSRA
jgi:hypothetical protein